MSETIDPRQLAEEEGLDREWLVITIITDLNHGRLGRETRGKRPMTFEADDPNVVV